MLYIFKFNLLPCKKIYKNFIHVNSYLESFIINKILNNKLVFNLFVTTFKSLN